MCKIQGFLSVNFSEARDNISANFGEQNWRGHPSLPPRVSVRKTSVCTFKTSPCVPAPRAHVSTHVRVVPLHTGTFWIYTVRFFLRATPQTPTPHTHHNTRRQTDRQSGQREKGIWKTRDKRTQHERKDKRRSRWNVCCVCVCLSGSVFFYRPWNNFEFSKFPVTNPDQVTILAPMVRQCCPASGSLFCGGLSTRSSDGSRSQLSHGPPTTWNSCSLPDALTTMISLLYRFLFGT